MTHRNNQVEKQLKSNLSRPELINKLSEFLAIERGGVKLYEAALQMLPDPEVLSRFGQFYVQTRLREEILQGVIRKFGW